MSFTPAPFRAAIVAVTMSTLLTACGGITIGAAGTDDPAVTTAPPTESTTGGGTATTASTTPPSPGPDDSTSTTAATEVEAPPVTVTDPIAVEPGTIHLGDNTPLLPVQRVALVELGQAGDVSYDVAVTARYADGAIELVVPVDPRTFAPTGEAVLAVLETSDYWSGQLSSIVGSPAGVDIVADVAIGDQRRTVRAQLPPMTTDVELLALVTQPNRLGASLGMEQLPEIPRDDLAVILVEIDGVATNPTDFGIAFADRLYQRAVIDSEVEPLVQVMAVYGDSPAVVQVLLSGAADDSSDGTLYSLALDPDDSVGWALIDVRLRGLCFRGVGGSGLCL